MKVSKRRFGCLAVVLGLIVSQSALYAVYLPEDEKGEDEKWFPKQAEFVPDEILIKLKPGPAAERFMERGELPGTLEELNRQFGVQRIEPVFTSVWEALKQEKIGFETYVERIRSKFPLRSNRAPKGAKIPDLSLWYKLELAEGSNVLAVVEEYKRDPNIEDAQPNYFYQTCDIPPDDPFYSSYGSWGQDYDDLWGLKKIECEDAWLAFESDDEIGAGVVVAVVDTGIDYNHEDLTENIWQNLGEDVDGDGHTLEYVGGEWVLDPGDINGDDDDNNGKVDDLIGWDFAYGDNNPMDGNGHGSHVSGTIAAVTDNGTGVSGVSWHSRIMPVKGLDDSRGSGQIDDLAEGIRYAADNGADVISNSWGTMDRLPVDPVAEEAVEYAYSSGAVIVFSAGNRNDDVAWYSPTNMDEVISVAATTQDDEKCSFSSWGEKINVSAPGGGYPDEPNSGKRNILSTLPDDSSIALESPELKVSNGYYRLSGTSMACPHVSGLAALLLSAHPDWANISVMWHIGATADNIDVKNPGYEGLLGSGRINAEKAVSLPAPPTEISVESFKVDDISGNGDGVADPGEEIDLKVYLRNVGETVQDVSADLTTDDPYVTIEKGHVTFAEIAYGERVEADYRFSVSESFASDHDLVFQLAITYEGGQETEGIVVPGYWREIYVNWENETPPWNGTREDPYQNIQDAIDSAEPYTKLRVARGTYRENIIIDTPVRLYGGYDPTEWSRDLRANITVIDGEGDGNVVTFYSGAGSTSVLSGFTIQGGYAEYYAKYRYGGGGGIYCRKASPTVDNCIITKNSSLFYGGGIFCQKSYLVLTNCIISNNSAYWGGGIFCEGSSMTVTNCTIAHNAASRSGGGISAWWTPHVITNSIIWGNVAEEGQQIHIFMDSGSPEITYSDVQGGWKGKGNIKADPLFVNPPRGDFHLIHTSPCIDAGTGEGAPDIDFEGEARPYGEGVDMGADERSPRDVDGDGMDDAWERHYFGDLSHGPDEDYDKDGKTNLEEYQSGTDPADRIIPYTYYISDEHGDDSRSAEEARNSETPWKIIGHALAHPLVRPGDTVIVAEGIYNENINFYGKSITLRSIDPDDPEVVAGTVIDGARNGSSVVSFISGKGNDSVLSGFTIQNGSAGDGGGGIYCLHSSPTITNNTITGNSANHNGGGIYCYGSSATITSNAIIDNSSGEAGGGISYNNIYYATLANNIITGNTAGIGGGVFCESTYHLKATKNIIADNSAGGRGGGFFIFRDSFLNISDSAIIDNSSGEEGGGIYSYEDFTLTNSIVRSNLARDGGGIWIKEVSPTLTNNAIEDNSASGNGGGIYSYRMSSPTLTSNTIVNNSAGGYGGGVYCELASSPGLTNNSITGNSANEGGGIYCSVDSYPRLINSTVANNTANRGGGIICLLDSGPEIINSILWGNEAREGAQIYKDSGSHPEAYHSDIQGGWEWEGGWNIDADPFFVPGPSGGYYLSQIAAGQDKNSPCVDAGDSGSKLIDGTTRTDRVPDIGIVDMGYHYRARYKNLVRNGGFEHAQRKWNLNSVVASIDDTVSYKGKKSLRLDFTGGAQGGKKHAWQKNIEVVPGSSYELAGFVMTDNLQGGAVQIQVVDQENGSRTFDVRTEEVSGTVDWTKISAEFSVPEETRLLKVIIRSTSTGIDGTAWFDKISLRKTAP